MPVADAAPGGAPVIFGAAAIGAFLFPNDPPRRRKRRVYHLATEARVPDRIPVFRLGATLCARPETLLAWLAECEKRRAA